CDTMVIDTDRGRCTLTWRQQIPIDHPAQPGRVVISASIAQPVGGMLAGDGPAPSQTVPFVRTASPTLPFVRTAFGPPSTVREAAGPSRGLWNRTLAAALRDAIPALPFRAGRSPLAGTVLGAPPSSPRTPDDGEATRVAALPAGSSTNTVVFP